MSRYLLSCEERDSFDPDVVGAISSNPLSFSSLHTTKRRLGAWRWVQREPRTAIFRCEVQVFSIWVFGAKRGTSSEQRLSFGFEGALACGTLSSEGDRYPLSPCHLWPGDELHGVPKLVGSGANGRWERCLW
jgi:hypothetical protein